MLTKQNIKHLRTATDIAFYHSHGVGLIRTLFSKPTSPTIDTFEITTDSKIRASCIEPGLHDGQRPLSEVACGSYFLTMSESRSAWKTIAGLLRTGDMLTLEWYRDHWTNGYAEKASLHGDSLSLLVDRGKKKLTFLVAVSFCENNTARMIRRGAYNNE